MGARREIAAAYQLLPAVLQAEGQATRGREGDQALSCSSPRLSKVVKRRLRKLYRTLDPVAPLAEMRGAQGEFGTRVDVRSGRLAAAISPRAPTKNAAAFAKGLGNDVHLGEQRIIHRRMRKSYKRRTRMPSMLDPHLAAPAARRGYIRQAKVTFSGEAIRGIKFVAGRLTPCRVDTLSQAA